MFLRIKDIKNSSGIQLVFCLCLRSNRLRLPTVYTAPGLNKIALFSVHAANECHSMHQNPDSPCRWHTGARHMCEQHAGTQSHAHLIHPKHFSTGANFQSIGDFRYRAREMCTWNWTRSIYLRTIRRIIYTCMPYMCVCMHVITPHVRKFKSITAEIKPDDQSRDVY